jgi:hypothetical protein
VVGTKCQRGMRENLKTRREPAVAHLGPCGCTVVVPCSSSFLLRNHHVKAWDSPSQPVSAVATCRHPALAKTRPATRRYSGRRCKCPSNTSGLPQSWRYHTTTKHSTTCRQLLFCESTGHKFFSCTKRGSLPRLFPGWERKVNTDTRPGSCQSSYTWSRHTRARTDIISYGLRCVAR